MSFNRLLLSIILICPAIVLGQSPNKKGTMHFGYAMNLLVEDGNQFQAYLNNEKVYWNLSPFNFSFEYRLNEKFGIQSMFSSNLYQANQRYKGLTLKKPIDIISLDLLGKANLLPFLKDTGNFDPYVVGGFGLLKRGVNTDITTQIGFGFNYWVLPSFGFNFNSTYKLNFITAQKKGRDNQLNLNLGFVYIIN